jgi:hypothetical protein
MGGTDGGGNDIAGTTIDATAIPTGTSDAVIRGPGNNYGSVYRDFRVKLQTAGAYPYSASAGMVGLDPGYFGFFVSFSDVDVVGGNIAFRLVKAQNVTFRGCRAKGPRAFGLASLSSYIVASYGSMWSDATGDNGTASHNGANVFLSNSAAIDGGGPSGSILLCDALTDEAGGISPNTNASIWVDDAYDVQILTPVLYLAKAGYGIRVGNGTSTPHNISVRGMNIQPYAGDRVPVNTIKIETGAYNVRLEDIVTNPNGGGDILDNGTGTVWRNVNGITRAPSYTTATKPAAAAANAGMVIYVSDGGAGNVIQASNGGAWVSLG